MQNGVEILSAINQTIFRNALVRVRFDSWEFSPEKNLFAFSFEENRVDTSRYVLPALVDQYAVFVAVRKKDATPPDQGPISDRLGSIQNFKSNASGI
jgi:hypothetical protein